MERGRRGEDGWRDLEGCSGKGRSREGGKKRRKREPNSMERSLKSRDRDEEEGFGEDRWRCGGQK